MKRLTSLAIAIVALAGSTVPGEAGLFDSVFGTTKTTTNPAVYGRIVSLQNAPTPVLAEYGAVPPAPAIGGGTKPTSEPIKLYHCVKYEDRHNIHPCAVKMIVQVNDPCTPKPDRCGCCQPVPRCVFVEICVPPCGCAKIKVSRSGSKVEYDYGKYEVEIKSKNGVVYVDYDD